jgi:ribose/xylose/arabinose/galactoside ABC-type transport system permease subunit
LVGIGQSLVMMTGFGGIDLSVGANISLSGMILGLLVRAGCNIWVSCLLVLLFGVLLGAINGINVAFIGIPPLIATLGTLYVYGTLALLINGGIPIGGFPESFEFLGQGNLLGMPTQFVVFVIPAFLILHYVVSKTKFGRDIYLTGTNEQAADLAGVRTKMVRFIIYTLSGMLSAISGIIMASWVMSARGNIGTNYEMQAITVATLGGIAVDGGEGNLIGTLLAVVVVTMISSGLQLANINTIWQLAILGIILIVSVSSNRLIASRRS